MVSAALTVSRQPELIRKVNNSPHQRNWIRFDWIHQWKLHVTSYGLRRVLTPFLEGFTPLFRHWIQSFKESPYSIKESSCSLVFLEWPTSPLSSIIHSPQRITDSIQGSAAFPRAFTTFHQGFIQIPLKVPLHSFRGWFHPSKHLRHPLKDGWHSLKHWPHSNEPTLQPFNDLQDPTAFLQAFTTFLQGKAAIHQDLLREMFPRGDSPWGNGYCIDLISTPCLPTPYLPTPILINDDKCLPISLHPVFLQPISLRQHW